MTRVMFSRGNISEKIRFGQLVKEGDVVLDMYAGIGYYSLVAAVLGRASHVYACEWNQYAAEALRYNIKDNHVDDRVTVFQGDCRTLARDHKLTNKFDRVSLGLLPSSEGGWRTAVRALKSNGGGWLHVHGNVPEKEVDSWKLWLCQSLLLLAKEEERPSDWVVLCDHVEKVKSFAPTVSHYVADVFVGSVEKIPQGVSMMGFQAGVIQDGEFFSCPNDVPSPSCALSADGVLCQAWMREELDENDPVLEIREENGVQ
jgi:tRNA G37 N-methylase Trm5